MTKDTNSARLRAVITKEENNTIQNIKWLLINIFFVLFFERSKKVPS